MKILSTLLLALSILLTTGASHAALITGSFSGVITYSDNPIVGIGDEISGTYAYDSSLLTNNWNMNYSSNFGFPVQMTFDVGSLHYSFTGNGEVTYGNNFSNDFPQTGLIVDLFIVRSFGMGNYVSVDIRDSNSDFITSLVSPASIQWLSDGMGEVPNSNEAYLGGYGYRYNLVGLGLSSAVPEPTSVALFGIGLLGLMLVGRRSNGRKNLFKGS